MDWVIALGVNGSFTLKTSAARPHLLDRREASADPGEVLIVDAAARSRVGLDKNVVAARAALARRLWSARIVA